MVLRLRLSRLSTPTGAKRHSPFYNIVLAHDRTARDGKPMEVLGTYNPIPQTPVGAQPGDRKIKDIKIDVSRTKYWLGVGAQPSDTVWRLLAMIGLLEPRYLPQGPQTLKAVRFPTHVPREPKSAQPTSTKPKQPLPSTPLTEDTLSEPTPDEISVRVEEPAGTTSPQDPNTA